MIEAAASCPGDMRVDCVEALTSLLVSVEALIKEVAQKSSGLRDTESVRARRGENRRRIMLAPRDKIAHGGESGADNRRIFRGVNDLIDFSGNEAAIEMDGHGIGEAPLAARNRAAHGGRRIALGQDARAVFDVCRRIAGSANRSLDDVRDGVIVDRLVDNEVGPHLAGDSRGDWRVQLESPAIRPNIELPADPGDRVAAVE